MQIENLSLTVIKFIDDISSSIDTCIELFGASSTPSVLVDKIQYIEQYIKEIDKTVSTLPSTIQGLCNGYSELFSSLKDNRNSLMCKINEREAMDIQMNTMGDMYDKDIIMDDISISINDVYPDSIYDVRIDPIIDPHEYSVLAVVNKFQNEKGLIDDLASLFFRELNISYSAIDEFRQNILNVKTMIHDGEVVNRLLEDDTDTYNAILISINGCSSRLHRFKDIVKKMFNIYKSMINNYGIYNTAIAKYTSLALESVFNTDLPYEIC